MRLLKGISLFVFASFLLSSCGGGAISNELVKQLPDDQKAVFVKNSTDFCNCYSKMKGDISKIEAIANTLDAKADEIVAAIEAGNGEKAVAAYDAMNDANTAYAEAEKAFEEENKEMRECINNVGNDMSDADRELLGKARLSLVELTHAKYGGTPEGEKKFREIEFELCPASAKIPRFLETRNRAYSKITDLHEKIMEIKENSTLYSPGVTEGDSTSTETTPER